MAMYFWVTVGSAIGGIARYWCSGLVANSIGSTFPWGTLVVNVVGCFVIGFFATVTGTDGRFFLPAEIRSFVMVGFCGGFTTFSSFSLQTLALLQDGDLPRAAGNVVASFILCMVSVWLGYVAALMINQLRVA